MPYNKLPLNPDKPVFETIDTIPILQVNTGNGLSKKTDKAVLDLINTHNCLICGISESNAQVLKGVTMEKRRILYSDFNIEDKIWPGYGLSRFSLIISKRLHYTRRHDLENDHNACIVIEVKRTKNKKIYIVGNYRQWRGKSPSCPYNDYKNEHALKGFKSLVQIWSEVMTL